MMMWSFGLLKSAEYMSLCKAATLSSDQALSM